MSVFVEKNTIPKRLIAGELGVNFGDIKEFLIFIFGNACLSCQRSVFYTNTLSEKESAI